MRTRRQFLQAASAVGATLALGVPRAFAQAATWTERREFYPQGVASGDPAPYRVILWTRLQPKPGDPREKHLIHLEVARDRDFKKIEIRAFVPITAETDWTCRFYAANLKPSTEYWYRFTDEDGNGSRIGRTLTAPKESDSRPVRFTFVSCQDVGQSACNAYRRMIWEDERRPRDQQLGFVCISATSSTRSAGIRRTSRPAAATTAASVICSAIPTARNCTTTTCRPRCATTARPTRPIYRIRTCRTRTFRYGKNTEMILTDNRSFKTADANLDAFVPEQFSQFADEDAARVLDDGRTYDGGKPPVTLRFGDQDVPNPQRDSARQSYLGATQRAWLIEKLRASKAPWKVGGHSFGTLAWRSDLQNLPAGVGPKWPGKGYGLINGGYYSENEEIFSVDRKENITGLAIVAGDKHSFWAGLATADLPPRKYDPVAVEFITGSISALGLAEALPYNIKDDDPLRALYIVGPKENSTPSIKYSESMKQLLKRRSYNTGTRPSEHHIGKKSFLTNNAGAIPSNVITLANTPSETKRSN